MNTFMYGREAAHGISNQERVQQRVKIDNEMADRRYFYGEDLLGVKDSRNRYAVSRYGFSNESKSALNISIFRDDHLWNYV